MDPNITKHVTDSNIVSEDIKPEGRTDGPKNFGPEFVTGPGGKVVPTRPAEQMERTARAVADGARAEGKDEAEVARQFAQTMPENVAPVPASAEPVPPVVLGSMSAHDRAEHEAKEKKKYSGEGEELLRMQYDIGYAMATDGKAEPLEASDALKEGYQDARAKMLEHLQLRRERESEGAGKKPAAVQPPSKAAEPAATDTAEGKAFQREFDAGVAAAKKGDTIAPDASEAFQNGYHSVPEKDRGKK